MHNRKRRTAAFAASALVAALVAAGCSSGTSGTNTKNDEGTPVKGGTLNMLGVGDVDYVDPNVTYYSAGYMLGRLYSRQLYTFPAVKGKTTEVVPDLATDMPKISDDGKTYTITLKDGVKWDTQPAREVTAADFVRGIKRTCNPTQPFGASLYFTSLIEGMQKFCDDFQAPYAGDNAKPATPAQIKQYVENTDLPGVVAKDDKTIEIHLTRPASYFTSMMGLSAFSPAPVEVLNYLPGSAELGKHQISDGPYKIDTYDPTKTIELSRNPAWDPKTDDVRKAYVDKIVINETGEQKNIQQQLETNKASADMAWDTFPTAQEVPSLRAKKDPNLILTETSSSNPYIVFNTQSPNLGGALKKVEFRKGLEHAINRDNIIQVLGGDLLNKPLTHVLPPSIVGGDEGKIDLYPYDVNKAKDFFTQAGTTSGTLKVLYRNESNGSTKTFQTLQSDLGKVGFKVEGVPSSNADFYTKYLQSPRPAKSGVWDLAIAGWGSDWYGNAALSYFQPLFQGEKAFPPNGSNFGLYENPEVDKAIDEAGAADESEVAKKWADVDKMIMEDAAFFPITNPVTANYKASHVHNAVGMDVFQNFDPSNVWIEKKYQD